MYSEKGWVAMRTLERHSRGIRGGCETIFQHFHRVGDLLLVFGAVEIDEGGDGADFGFGGILAAAGCAGRWRSLRRR